jgi:hypothetical protein
MIRVRAPVNEKAIFASLANRSSQLRSFLHVMVEVRVLNKLRMIPIA